jgi:putative aldouronate transport system substrate-binding protein
MGFGGGTHLSIFVPDIGPGVSYNSDKLPILEIIQENTGVVIDWEAPGTDYWNVLNTRIASGMNLPDMMMTNLTRGFYDALNGGLAIPMNPLIDEYAPSLKALFAKYPGFKSDMQLEDGTIYGISVQVQTPEASYTNTLSHGYRRDWAEKLDVAEPTTIAGWEVMLRAFKSGDPNGNGKDDEIPYGTAGSGTWSWFAGSYGLPIKLSNGWSADDNGVVTYCYYSQRWRPAMKAYLELISRWYADELIGQDMLTSTQTTMRAQILGNIAGSHTGWAQRVYAYNGMMEADTPSVDWAVAPLPTSEYGPAFNPGYAPWDTNRFIISKDCDDPEIAMQFIDYLIGPEGTMLQHFGIEGETYNMVNGQPVFTEKAIAEAKQQNTLQSYIANLGGASRLPHVVPEEYSIAAAKLNGISEEALQRIRSIAENNTLFWQTPEPTREQRSALSKLNDIQTYMNEVLVNIVIGSSPVSDYDSLVVKMKEMGIEEVIKVQQELYDRKN